MENNTFSSVETLEEKRRNMQEWLAGERAKLAEDLNMVEAAQYFVEKMTEDGEHSRTLALRNGKIDAGSYLVDTKDLHKLEDFYQFMHKISQKYHELYISFETDPSGKCIKYTVIKK